LVIVVALYKEKLDKLLYQKLINNYLNENFELLRWFLYLG